MDPKGKGMVTNDKEKETIQVDEPKGDKPLTQAQTTRERMGRRKGASRRLSNNKRKYDIDASSSSPRDDDDEDSSIKKKTINQNYSFDYSRIPYNSNAHLLSIPLGNPPTLMETTTLF